MWIGYNPHGKMFRTSDEDMERFLRETRENGFTDNGWTAVMEADGKVWAEKQGSQNGRYYTHHEE